MTVACSDSGRPPKFISIPILSSFLSGAMVEMGHRLVLSKTLLDDPIGRFKVRRWRVPQLLNATRKKGCHEDIDC
jgi:hypothetical protein